MRGVQFFGIASTVLLSVALMYVPSVPRPTLQAHELSPCRPQYWEIYKFKEVIGISVLFMLVDMLGGVFSDLSLAFKDSFDVVAGVAYSLVVVRSTASTLFLATSKADFGTGSSWMASSCSVR